MSVVADRLLSDEPVVRLVNAFAEPYNNAVATARTCYSSRVIGAEDVRKDEQAMARRDAIAESIYKAGHHTTIQHATFQFVLENVSRQCLWSFLHSHPYYNSEQVSQRYVEVKQANFTIPPLPERQASRYREVLEVAMGAYQRLIELLAPVAQRAYAAVFPSRDLEEKRWASAVKKKALEVARYALPVATHAHLYHTVSGITLHRYHRLCEQLDAPLEQRLVVQKMIEAVHEHDPLFFKQIEDVIPLEETLEYRAFQELLGGALRADPAFIHEFDEGLGGRSSVLVDYKVHTEGTLAQAVRSVLGLPRARLSDAEAIRLIMDPARNHYLGEALTLTTLSKLTRAMVHPHFTFRKKLSHTADSQDQRHRMTPGSRPVLARQVLGGRPDYIVPVLVQEDAGVQDFYEQTMREMWQGIEALLNDGVSEEAAVYLLPNAVPIRFEESGDLLNFHHKWTQRLCYNAQEEIWKTCWEETQQVKARFPLLAEFLLPPCGLRARAGQQPICPEGERFCGVAVWKLPLEQYERVI